jgi:hypothetical protein
MTVACLFVCGTSFEGPACKLEAIRLEERNIVLWSSPVTTCLRLEYVMFAVCQTRMRRLVKEPQ